jgi:hypothetical protein
VEAFIGCPNGSETQFPPVTVITPVLEMLA